MTMARWFNYVFSRFDTIPACDTQMDGQLATTQSALCYAYRHRAVKATVKNSTDWVMWTAVLQSFTRCRY